LFDSISAFAGMASVVMYARWMILFLCCCAARSDSYYETPKTFVLSDGGHETPETVHGVLLENSPHPSDAAVGLGEDRPTAMSIRSAKGGSKTHSMPRMRDLPAAAVNERREEPEHAVEPKHIHAGSVPETPVQEGSLLVDWGDSNTSQIPLPYQGSDGFVKHMHGVIKHTLHSARRSAFVHLLEST